VTPVDAATAALTPVDVFLAEQGRMTAVERFARHHDDTQLLPGDRYYRDLIPLSVPGPGQQYGFEVDLDACTGCKACVIACHTLNGLDEGESFRSAGMHHGTAVLVTQQTITTACHHCVDPACLSGCPTRAYEKNALTGIVLHDEKLCLGCGYCTWMCPYEVPRFNEARGVVRKCDMCHDRLSAGEAPACVSACPNGAISVRVVDTQQLRIEAAEPNSAILPTAPPSGLTTPATRYLTAWEVPADITAADYRIVRPGHGHRPLVAMLVLTQIAVGVSAVGAFGALRGSRPAAITALVLALAGMIASVAHLGQPQRLWRCMAGLRTSWLSREVAALGAFTTLTALNAIKPSARLALVTAAVGGVAVACSGMLYVVTGRPWWKARLTLTRFAFTVVVGGLAGGLALGAPGALGWVLGLVTLAGCWTALAAVRRWGRVTDLTHLRRSAMLLTGPLRSLSLLRVGLGVGGGVIGSALMVAGVGPAPVIGWLVLATVGVAEVADRLLFFRAAAWTAMPGVLD